MEQARQRIEKIKQQQRKRMLGSAQTTTAYSSAHKRSQFLIALGGVALGLMIAAVIWLMKPLATDNNYNSILPVAAQPISADELKKTNDNIAQLNYRMELLADTISNMDAKFERILAINDSMTNAKNNEAYPLQKLSSIPEVVAPEFDKDSSGASQTDSTAIETEQAFFPTHRVNARINLRASTELNTTPITVLDAGTEVEYISQTDGWYYVNTRSHGKGWCSSDYLTDLHPTKQDAS